MIVCRVSFQSLHFTKYFWKSKQLKTFKYMQSIRGLKFSSHHCNIQQVFKGSSFFTSAIIKNVTFHLCVNVCCYSVKTPQFHQIHDHLYQIDLINTLNSSSHPQLYRKIRANFYQAITGPKIYKWFPVSFCGVLSEVNWVLCETQTKDSEKLFPGKYLLMQSLYTIHVCCINY